MDDSWEKFLKKLWPEEFEDRKPPPHVQAPEELKVEAKLAELLRDGYVFLGNFYVNDRRSRTSYFKICVRRKGKTRTFRSPRAFVPPHS